MKFFSDKSTVPSWQKIVDLLSKFDAGTWIMPGDSSEEDLVIMLNHLIDRGKFFKLHFTPAGVVVEPTPEQGAWG